MKEAKMQNRGADAETYKSFEDKIKTAKEILSQLMSPDITLAKSVELYREGIKELAEAQEMLEKAKIEFEEAKK